MRTALRRFAHRASPDTLRLVFRKKRRASPALGPFLTMAAALDAAQRALLAAIPTSRDVGVPLAEALAGFDRELRRAEHLMPAWQNPQTDPWHRRCDAAIVETRLEADRLRLEPGRLEFEMLNARIGDVLHPLEVFADAERALRRGEEA